MCIRDRFVSPSNHKYDCQDYDHIDPHYGVILEDADGLVCPEDTDNDRAHKYMTRTADEQNLEASDAFFARLIEEAHKRGIRVLVDGESDDENFPLASRTEGNRLVRLKGDKSLIGSFIDVKITDSNTWALYGEPV